MRIDCKTEPIDAARMQEMRAVFDDDARMREKTDTSGGVEPVDIAVAGGAFFRVFADGRPVAWYVLQPMGDGAEIAAAYGRANFGLVEHVLPLIERQCAPLGAVYVTTKRRGLIRRLGAAGYEMREQLEFGVILRKGL